jgi:hypothetical protein
MAIPSVERDVALRHVALFCANSVPDEMREQVRIEYTIRGDRITILEYRPPWSALVGPEWTSMKIAQLRYDADAGTWTLFAADRNTRWFLYNDIPPASDVGPLLAEIGEDPTGIFWG